MAPRDRSRSPCRRRAELPIAAHREQLLELLSKHGAAIVVGETGSGKTTQIPQYLLDEPERWGAKRTPPRIAITQPRRLAAVAMARRVAQERGATLGEEVGYTIRFEDHCTSRTRLRYMTDGCLLRECLGDSELSSYDAVVLDEAHERSLHTDVLFALAKRAAARRAGSLRVLVTSATLDSAAFSAYFGCPVLEVPGRPFAVEVHYHSVSRAQRVEAAVNVALNLHVREGEGHVLVFLTGAEECEEAVDKAHAKLKALVAGGREIGDCLIAPLYGSMRSEDQRSVFEEAPCRKLIFATNVAETSLTVPGVGFVIDSGYCKQKSFNPRTGMESLIVTEVSQVQAAQRAGRAGRTQDGKCFRLYSQEAFTQSLPKATVPEILRSNLASVTLQMKAMGISDIVTFDFLDAPDRARLVRSLRSLFLLGALDADGAITATGREMAELPLEPQWARCLLAARELRCLGDMLTLAALLSAEPPWMPPARRSAAEARAAATLKHPLGDHLSLLRAYRRWESSGRSAEWSRAHALQHRALRQAREIRSQLRGLCQGAEEGQSQAREEPLLRALCAGFYMQTARACAAGGGWLVLEENVLVKPEGGSVLEGGTDDWVLYTELVGNTVAHCLMRNVSAVQHEWLRPHLPRMAEVDMPRLVGQGKKKVAKVERDPQDVAKEKDAKVQGARERYLARKLQR